MKKELDQPTKIFNEISNLLLEPWKEFTDKSIGILQSKLQLSSTDASALLNCVMAVGILDGQSRVVLEQMGIRCPYSKLELLSSESSTSSTSPLSSSKRKRKTSRNSTTVVETKTIEA